MRNSILVLVIFFIAGLVLLAAIKIPRTDLASPKIDFDNTPAR